MKMLIKNTRIMRRKMRRLASRPTAAANFLMPEVRTNVGRANETMNVAMPSQRTINQTSPFGNSGNNDPVRIEYSNRWDKTDDVGLQLKPIDTSFSLPSNYLQLCAQ